MLEEDAIQENGKAGRDTRAPRGWHTRGYLPHFESDCVIQMVTFRLADSLPHHIAKRLAEETDTKEGDLAYRRRIEAWLDSGYGESILRESWVAQTVEDSLLHFNDVRYRLHRWVIMPNHVHVLIRMLEPYLLQDSVKGWKSFTAREINKRLGRAGAVWQMDYWDRYIRDEKHYGFAAAYIHGNPVKARLAARPEDWCWSSAWERGCPHPHTM